MNNYTGYGKLNTALNMLEEVKLSASLRANDLMLEDIERAKASAAQDAYAFSQHILINLNKFRSS